MPLVFSKYFVLCRPLSNQSHSNMESLNAFALCWQVVLARYSPARARAAMPFGCLTLGEKKDYNSPSEVTDKYDLGQIVKS